MNKLRWFGVLAVCTWVIGERPVKAWCPLLSEYGVGTILHPLQKPECPCNPGPERPGCSAEHVHIFAINGFDPLCIGNFNGLCAYVKEHGYANVEFAQLYTGLCLAEEIRKIRSRDPSARIVLIGYSWGCNRIRWLANRLAADGTRVDLLVYMGGDFICATPWSYPENVGRVLNITAHGFILTGGDLLNGADLPGAHNCRLKTRHLQIPSRREALDLLMEELSALSCAPAGALAAVQFKEGIKSGPAAK